MADEEFVCTRCGRCCTRFVVHIDCDGPDARRFFTLHGMEVVQGENGGMLRIRQVCEALSYEDGKAVCTIYEDRPRICCEYSCGGR